MEVIKRQLVIKNIAVAVERRFLGTLGQAGFLARALPAFAVLVGCYWNGSWTEPGTLLPGWAIALLTLVAAWFALTASARRFRDIGLGGANVLQLIIPIFVYFWIGPKLAAHLPEWAVAAIFLAWPAIVFLRLALQPSKPAA